MFGFTKVEWTDHELAAFVKKHDLFHEQHPGFTNWKKRGAMHYTHAVVTYDNSCPPDGKWREIWINDEVLAKEGK